MLEGKRQLKEDGIPADAEHAMVANRISVAIPAKAGADDRHSRVRKAPANISAKSRERNNSSHASR